MNGLVAKEIRALLFPWLGCLALLGAAALMKTGYGSAYSVLVIVGGSCALGALSLGHEYTGATLASMLVLPVSRARVLLVKSAVLAVMLGGLLAFVFTGLFSVSEPRAGVAAVAVLSGLCLAPWFTLVTRNPLAGAVFGISILGVIWVLLNVRLPPATVSWAFWRIAAVLGVAAVALTWRGFLRLEAIDGRGPHVHMGLTEASAAPRVRHAVWTVLRKEFGLQQLPLVLAAIYVLGSFRLISHASEGVRDVFGGLTVLFSGVMALLIGSIASAEERQLGTLDWHQLLPMASWKQWSLKAGTAIGLSLLLGVALPAVILLTSGGAIRLTAWYVAGVVLFTAIGLYVSSLSSSSLRALVLSSTVILVLMIAISATRIAPRLGAQSLTPINAALLVAFVVLLLRLAFDNHRTAERSLRRVCVHLFILWSCLAFELVIAAVAVMP